MEVFKIPAVFAFYEASVLAACAKVGYNNVVAFFAPDGDDCLRKAPCFAVGTVLQKAVCAATRLTTWVSGWLAAG